jgi:hypothetical protein
MQPADLAPGSSPGRLVAYVTSHGFGHLNRTVAVLNHLPAEVPLTIRCDRSLFAHWRERLSRPADLEPFVSDVGAVNPPGDSARTDGEATLRRAMARHATAWDRVDDEAAHLRRVGASAVLADAPALPLVAAHRAGVPGYALANFTWSEIYAEHAESSGDPAAMAFVDDLRRCYAHATAVFRASPGLAMTEFSRSIDVGLVVSPGRDRRAELRQSLGLDPDAKVVYFYVGRYGQDNLDYAALARHAPAHFVGFHAPPDAIGQVPNLHAVAPSAWTGADLLASSDAAVAKAGYGAVAEAMSARTPLLYPPRTGFAEHEALDASLRAWGAGFEIPLDRFAQLDFADELEQALGLDPAPPAPFPIDGAARVADHLVRVCRGASV